jgi:hypothetical protein
VTYSIVDAHVGRVSGVSTSDGPTAGARFGEGVAAKVCAGTGVRATVLASLDGRSTSERNQRQGRNDEGSGEDHLERGGIR